MMGFDLGGSTSQTAQPLSRIFGQKLGGLKKKKEVVYNKQARKCVRKCFETQVYYYIMVRYGADGSYRPLQHPPTILQRDLASSENLLEYSSSTSLTSRSTSSLLIFFFLCWKGDWPSIISYSRQPSAHQSGLKV